MFARNVGLKVHKVIKVADVLVILKVFPESDEINLTQLSEEIKKRLPEGYRLVKNETEPIAYGLKALIAYIQMPENTEGGTDKLEELVNGIEGVSHAEVVNVTRLGF
ncbi:elongation factor 1-beta [Sulfolobus acidocaldarius DSM 639]|nr:elongation factor 1-beta [Sulfolobus acidocaldarius DSM 639]